MGHSPCYWLWFIGSCLQIPQLSFLVAEITKLALGAVGRELVNSHWFFADHMNILEAGDAH